MQEEERTLLKPTRPEGCRALPWWREQQPGSAIQSVARRLGVAIRRGGPGSQWGRDAPVWECDSGSVLSLALLSFWPGLQWAEPGLRISGCELVAPMAVGLNLPAGP